MKDNKLLNLAQEFAVGIIIIANELRNKKEYSISDQIKRSGTSISANIAEAQYPQSLPDMLSKLKIARKECFETESWLKLLFSTGHISEEIFKEKRNLCGRIRRILTASCITIEKKIQIQ